LAQVLHANLLGVSDPPRSPECAHRASAADMSANPFSQAIMAALGQDARALADIKTACQRALKAFEARFGKPLVGAQRLQAARAFYAGQGLTIPEAYDKRQARGSGKKRKAEIPEIPLSSLVRGLTPQQRKKWASLHSAAGGDLRPSRRGAARAAALVAEAAGVDLRPATRNDEKRQRRGAVRAAARAEAAGEDLRPATRNDEKRQRHAAVRGTARAEGASPEAAEKFVEVDEVQLFEMFPDDADNVEEALRRFAGLSHQCGRALEALLARPSKAPGSGKKRKADAEVAAVSSPAKRGSRPGVTWGRGRGRGAAASSA